MPWAHCENEAILDDAICPSCNTSKATWTLEFEKTRQFRITRRPSLRLLLLDPAGTGVPGEPYRVEFPGGAVVEGELDDQGTAKVPCDARGQSARILLPRRRPDEVRIYVPPEEAGPEEGGKGGTGQVDPASDGEGAAFACAVGKRLRLQLGGRALTIRLHDPEGEILPGAEYVLTAGGEERRGVTDADGLLAEEGLPAGEVQIQLCDGRRLVFPCAEDEAFGGDGEAPDVPDEEEYSEVGAHYEQGDAEGEA